MLEVFKIVVLCLICTIITAIFSTVLLTAILFIILTLIFYDFNFEIPFERHAINKIKHALFKVRNLFYTIQPQINYSNHYIYSPNMSNVDKKPSDFDLSKFNRSGSVFSPISKIGSSQTRRLPTQTSTPLTRNSPWQKNSSTPLKAITFQNSTISRSPRYSLSSNEDNSKDVKNNSQSPAVQTVAGPLLASTRFNINLGMYTDTKSPGLVNRIVQYHNESQSNEAQTHQSKYKSPGQFPIVQLYRKKLPLLTRTPKRCTVRVAPPDCAAYNSPEGNKILKDTFVQRSTENNMQPVQTETEIYTKSVLDALKEISRKRIHSNDDLDELSKRQRKCSVSSSDNTNKDGKRLREDTPPKPKGQPTSPSTTNKPKKICVTNEIECSLSSSVLMRLQGQKRKAGILGDNVVTNTVKQRRISSKMNGEKNGNHISRTTQTPSPTSKINNNSAISHSTQTTPSETNQKDQEDIEKSTEKQEYTGLQQILQNAKRKKKLYFEKSIDEIDDERSSVHFNNKAPNYKPLFSHEPMEIIMKNRLEVAMAALNGDKPEIIPLPKLTLTEMLEKKKQEAQNENPLKESRALTSILSPKNKSKHDKHVSFDIPDKPNDNNNDAKCDQPESNPKLDELKSDTKPSLGPQFSFGPITSTTLSNHTVSTPVVQNNLQISPQFKFGESPTAPTTLSEHQNTQQPSTPAPSLISSPNSNFGMIPPNSGPNTPKSSENAPKSTETVPKSNVPNFNFGSQSFTASNGGAFSVGGQMVGTVSSTPDSGVKPTVAFGGTQSVSVKSNVAPKGTMGSAVSFGGFGGPKPMATAVTKSDDSSKGTLNFGSKLGGPISISGGFGAVGTSAPSSGGFGAVATTATSFSIGKTQESPFSFGAKSVASPPKTGGFKFDFDGSKPVSTNSEQPKLENAAAFNFGGNPPAFGSTVGTFGGTATTTASLAVFGATSTVAAPSSVFGISNTQAAQKSLSFGSSSSSAPIFGGTTTATPIFGANSATSAPGFGTNSAVVSTTATVFGGTSVPTTAPVFGSTLVSTSAPVFGSNTSSNGAFGATSTTSAPVFGTTTTSSVFGQKTESTNFNFSSTTQSGTFGSFTAPTTQSSGFSFGSASNPVATTTSTTSSFNFGSTQSSAKPFSFNASTTSNVFGGTNTPSFGSPAPSSGVFGAPTTTSSSNVFGSTVTTQSSNVFGSTETKTAPSGFGTNSGVFGSGSTGFGSNNNNSGAFGQNNSFAPNQDTPFGSGATSPVFGGNPSSTNVFASPTVSKPAFGTNPPSFGSSTFGNAPAPSFGATTQPSGVFGTNSTPANTFGSANTANNNNNQNSSSFGGFGGQPAPSGGIFTFGQNATNNSAFQFGGNSATNTPTKPSGFNFSNSTTPNLNFTGSQSAAPPAFGAQSPPPAFGQPNAMFSIGTGAPQKNRNIIKARRRNNNQQTQ